MSNKKNDTQFVWTKYILLFGSAVIAVAFGYLAVWSFGETRDWFRFLDFDGNVLVSLSLALIFQFGQGPVLYLRMRYAQRYRELSSRVKRYGNPPSNTDPRHLAYNELVYEMNSANVISIGFAVTFFIFAAVDGWTNVKQMHLGLDSSPVAHTTDKYVFTSIAGFLLVFVEEGFGMIVSTGGNILNDIRQIHGKRRWGWLDMFGEIASEQLTGRERDSRPNNQNNNNNAHRQTSSYNNNRPQPIATSRVDGGDEMDVYMKRLEDMKKQRQR
jgi:hypothetical protein